MKLRQLGGLGLLGLVLACEPVSKPGPSTVPQSNTVATLADGTLASLDADHDQLVLLTLDGAIKARVDVGSRPGQLTTRGNTVVVSNVGDRSITVVDATSGRVLQTVTVGVEPRGLAFLPDGTLAVALGGERAVALVDLETGTVQRKIALPQDTPFGVAVAGNRLYVTHLLGDTISSVEWQSGTARGVPARLDVGGVVLNPSLSRSITVSPDETEVAVPHVNLNNEGLRPDAEQGGGGYLGTPDQLPAVNPTLTVLDTRQDTVISKATPADIPFGGMPSDCFDCRGSTVGPSSKPVGELDPNGPASALLTQTNGTIPFDAQLNDPVQSAYLDNGRAVAVLARGSRNVFIWRRDNNGQRRELLQVSPVGHGADGMAVTADGKQLVVHNAFDLTLDVIDLPKIPEAQQGSFLGRKLERTAPVRETAPVTARGRVIAVSQVTLSEDVAAGRRLFHDATLPSMTQGPGITCGTCHAEGRNDNKTWMFIDGPRNTQSLAAAGEGRLGLATTTAPLHWKGEITTHRDLQRTVTEFMGGTGLGGTQLDQLAAFIDTIPAADNPVRDDETKFEEIVRGEQLFNDTTVGCASCHAGQHFTDNLTHDVLTDDVGMPTRDGRVLVPGFQTPVLHGVLFTAPYGHDGRYPTLEDMLEDLVRTDKMGKGSHLTDADFRALATYLRSL